MAETVYAPTAAAFGRGGFANNPYAWLFTGEDQLRIGVVNSLTGVVVTVQGRFLPLNGTSPQPFVFRVSPTSDRTMTEVDFPIGVGFLLNVSAIVESGAPLIGQTYIMIQIIRGFGAKVVLGCLLGGYITASQHLAYPGSPIQSSIEGGGVTRFILGTQPAFGGEFSESVPTGARWELLSLRGILRTDATVVSRTPQMQAFVIDRSHAIVTQPGSVPASRVISCHWNPGMTLAVNLVDGWLAQGWPIGMPLLAGHKLISNTIGLQAGDRWDGPIYSVREWLEVA